MLLGSRHHPEVGRWEHTYAALAALAGGGKAYSSKEHVGRLQGCYHACRTSLNNLSLVSNAIAKIGDFGFRYAG